MSSADTRTAAIDVAIMTTARDAVMDAYRPCTISSPHAAAVLAALGIPPDATVDDIRAGLTLIRLVERGWTEGGPSLYKPGSYVVSHAPTWVYEPSPAAAVLALAARLEERDDA